MTKNKILLVEDDLAIMETLSMFLSYEGYEVQKAGTIEQALGFLEQTNWKPDLVLLDYMLQDNTAEPVIEAIRLKYSDNVVVLLLTAIDDPSAKCEEMHADGVVAKPFELDVLLQSIRDALDAGKFPLAGGAGVPKNRVAGVFDSRLIL